jgi:hypothetical protein
MGAQVAQLEGQALVREREADSASEGGSLEVEEGAHGVGFPTGPSKNVEKWCV